MQQVQHGGFLTDWWCPRPSCPCFEQNIQQRLGSAKDWPCSNIMISWRPYIAWLTITACGQTYLTISRAIYEERARISIDSLNTPQTLKKEKAEDEFNNNLNSHSPCLGIFQHSCLQTSEPPSPGRTNYHMSRCPWWRCFLAASDFGIETESAKWPLCAPLDRWPCLGSQLPLEDNEKEKGKNSKIEWVKCSKTRSQKDSGSEVM